MEHPLGKPISKFMKFIMGGLGLLLVVALVAGPLAIFSSLNPVAVDNKVTGSRLRFDIVVGRTGRDNAINKYTIYRNNYVVQLQSINDHLYKNMSLNTHIYTRNFDRSLFQMIEMSENSDSVWDMSPPNQIQLFNTLEEALVNINSTNLEINLELTYSFDRPKPEGAGALEQSIYLNLMDPSVVGRKLIIQKLRDAVNPHTP